MIALFNFMKVKFWTSELSRIRRIIIWIIWLNLSLTFADHQNDDHDTDDTTGLL